MTRVLALRFLASLACALCVVAMAPRVASAQEYRSLIGQGWTFMEAGNYRKAEEAFKLAFETVDGRNAAETYYAISALWWERRNAMAAYMWLSDAQKASRAAFNWESGPDAEWDKRIAKRREYIERNFAAIRLRAPSRGTPLPPLADPSPADPLLREFTDRLPSVIQEGVAEKVAVQWVLLPIGQYWVGDELHSLDPGELDASKSGAWDLPKDGGKLRKSFDERLAAIAAGESPAQDRLAALDEAARREGEAAEATRRAAEQARAAEELRRADDESRREAEAAAARRAEAEAARRAEAESEAARRAEAEAAATQASAAAAEETARAAARADEEAAKQRAEREAAAGRERARAVADRVAAADAERVEADRQRQAQESAARAERARGDAERRAALAADEEARAAADRERSQAERARLSEEQRVRDEQAAADRRSTEADRARDESRRQEEWEAAQARMREEQDRARAEEELERERGREERSAPSPSADERFASRRMSLSVGGGGATVRRLLPDGGRGEVAWATQAEVAYVAPLPTRGLALPVGLSWANLPVSGCGYAQTRANGLAVHLGPRLAANIRGRLWLTGRIAGHVGAAGSFPTAAVRNDCATSSAEDGQSGLAYGARLTGEDGTSARLSLADLGWTGWAVLAGGDAEIGILGAPGQGAGYLGVAFFLRHDQVLPVVRGATYYFRPEDEPSSFALSSVTLQTVSSQASMARFQFGLRGQILF